MSLRGTAALGGLFLLLCAGYWLLQWRERQEIVELLEAKRILEWRPEEVTTLSIRQVGMPEVTAVRQETGWDIQAPNDSIRPLNILWDRVASALVLLTNERTIEESPADLAPYGLSEPALTVEAAGPGNSGIALAFGTQEPTRTHRYAQLNGQQVFLAPENLFFELNRSLTELRHPFLTDDRNAPLLRIEFAHIWTGRSEKAYDDAPAIGEESQVIVLSRPDAQSPWRQEQPVEGPVDQELVEELAREIQFSVTSGHIDNPEDLADYGLSPARARVTVLAEGSDIPQTFYFGEFQKGEEQEGGKEGETGGGGLYARREGQQSVFVVNPHIVTLWPNSPAHYRERRLLTHALTDIQRVAYERGTERWVIERDGESWRLVEPALPDHDPIALSQFLTRLKSVAASTLEIEPGSEAALEAPEVAITFQLAGDQEPRQILFARDPADDTRYVAQQDTGAVGYVVPQDAEAFHVSAQDFRSKDLLRVPAAEVTRIEFVFENTPFVLEKVHGQWLVRKPENYALMNQADAEAILAAVNPLVATSGMTVPETVGPQDPYGLGAPILSLYLITGAAAGAEAAPEQRHGPIRIGSPTEDQPMERYATAAGKEGVFRVRQDVIARLRDALRGVQPAPG